MARILTDGAEMGDGLGLSFGSPILRTTPVRSGTYAYEFSEKEYEGYALESSPTEIYLRVANNPGNSLNGLGYILFQDTSNSQTNFIRIDIVPSTNYYDIKINAVSVAIIDSVANFIAGQWNLIEVHVKIHATEGIIEIKEDGALLGQYEGDTTINGSSINYVTFYTNAWSVLRVDDIAINDTSGTEDNSWCGDGHIILYKPNASGSTTMLMGNDEDQTDNYALVDDIPSDGDTTYVYSGSAGYYDLYKLEDTSLPVNSVIKRVWVESRAKDPDTGYLKSVIQTASGSYTSGSVQMSTDYAAQKYDEYTTNPDTGVAWTSDEIDYLQAGIQIAE